MRIVGYHGEAFQKLHMPVTNCTSRDLIICNGGPIRRLAEAIWWSLSSLCSLKVKSGFSKADGAKRNYDLFV